MVRSDRRSTNPHEKCRRGSQRSEDRSREFLKSVRRILRTKFFHDLMCEASRSGVCVHSKSDRSDRSLCKP